ncbi:MAG: CPBP family intramembrane metalloprotease [Candidatus Lokiarchaeota archaeon]|nr:CPBP family intramembrane metalloprotease [Candidatus Lokiarchaeota archaeon]
MSNSNNDNFSKIFFFIFPWTIPVIVTLLTYLFYPLAAPFNITWLPLLIIYWITIWGYTLIYRKLRGGVFDKERLKLTLFLKGDHLWLQYLLTYGPLIYQIPMFIVLFAGNPNISITMYVTFILAAVVNGPSEEIFWRACMDDAGKNAGVLEKNRLIYAPIVFGFWHTAFIIHLFPWNLSWWGWWIGVILMTWVSGLIWMWVMHKSERLIPQCIIHSCGNFFQIFPLIIVTVLGFYF